MGSKVRSRDQERRPVDIGAVHTQNVIHTHSAPRGQPRTLTRPKVHNAGHAEVVGDDREHSGGRAKRATVDVRVIGGIVDVHRARMRSCTASLSDYRPVWEGWEGWDR